MDCILALDQGTTSSRALLLGSDGALLGISQQALALQHPQNGWVEQNPAEIFRGQVAAAEEVLKSGAHPVKAVGITNQRETTIVWDRSTGEAVYPAIVWQDRRTADRCSELRRLGISETIQQKTGLVTDPYFSATKLAWILESDPVLKKRARAGELCFGTVDSYLVWKLTEGRVHITDITNASRTMLFNINTLSWDEELLRLFDVPREMLPNVIGSSEHCGEISIAGPLRGMPIAGICGDQQAALFGQLCLKPGMAKNTYGTGCFLVMNTGDKPTLSTKGLVTTIAWKIGDKVTYALEGSVFVAGAAVQWLRDGLGLIGTSAEIEKLARSVPDSEGVIVVPAFTGLGAPYWDADARGAIFGVTRATTRAHIARATLDGIAFQVCDVVAAMKEDCKLSLAELRVDGGASGNDFLMQLQSDLLGSTLVRPRCIESTALGAAFLAGLATGFWKSTTELESLWQEDRRFSPAIPKNEAELRLAKWNAAVQRTLSLPK